MQKHSTFGAKFRRKNQEQTKTFGACSNKEFPNSLKKHKFQSSNARRSPLQSSPRIRIQFRGTSSPQILALLSANDILWQIFFSHLIVLQKMPFQNAKNVKWCGKMPSENNVMNNLSDRFWCMSKALALVFACVDISGISPGNNKKLQKTKKLEKLEMHGIMHGASPSSAISALMISWGRLLLLAASSLNTKLKSTECTEGTKVYQSTIQSTLNYTN